MGNNKRSKIGVVGARAMGIGIVQKFAQYGYHIVLIDIKKEILKKSKESINRNLRLHNMINPNKVNIIEIMDRISTSTTYEELKEVDIVIENIPGTIDEKLKVYGQMDAICKPECIYIVNTSCIPITKLGQGTNRGDKVIGVHFLNPATMQKFAEVIRGKDTSKVTIERVKNLLISVDMDCTVVNDSPGFVSNRLSHLFMNEAANLVMEGVATPQQIDKIFVEGFHHKMGPLQTADLIGIDTVVNAIEVLYECYQDSKYICSPYLKQLVGKGSLGRKAGKGFYEY